MYQINVFPAMRCISGHPLQILRTLNCRTLNLLNKTQGRHGAAPLSCASLLNKSHTLHPLGRTSLKDETCKVRPYPCPRWLSCQPVNSEDGVLIYTGSLSKAVLGVKFFSYSTSMFSLCVMPYILMKTGIDVNSFAMKVVFCSFIGLFTFLTPVLLHLVTKGYVVRLYHNKDTDMYTAVTYNVLLVEKKTTFHQSDIIVPDVSKMLTSFYAKKRSMIVNPMAFELPQDYNHLMGYDKPFSFDLDDIKKPDKN